jgi:hypothetical protein
VPAVRVSAQSLAQALGSDVSALDGPVWISGGSPESTLSPAAVSPTPTSFEALPDEEQCPGSSGPCQLSLFRGSLQQFDALGSGAQTNN